MGRSLALAHHPLTVPSYRIEIVMKFLSPETEPLRRYVYGVLILVLGFLVTVGVLTDTVALGLGGILAAALLVPAVEFARSKVTPVAEPALEDEYEPQHAA